MTMQRSAFVPPVLAAVCLIAFFLQSFAAMQSESDTWDEGLAIASDALRIFNGDWRIADYAPPLHTWLNAPALHLLKPSVPPLTDERFRSESYYGEFLLYRQNDARSVLFRCRLSVLLMACLMGWVLYRWGCRLGGPWAGVFAVFLMSVEPNLLTHSRIAAWDMLCASTMFIAAYAVWSWLESPSWGRAIAAGAALGISLISKYTALLLLPALASGILIYEWTKDPSAGKRALSKTWLLQILAGLGVAAAVIGLSYWGTNPVRYLRGAAQIYTVNVPPESYQSYLLGRVLSHTVKYYYLCTFLMKTPIPLLISIVLVFIFLRKITVPIRHLLFILSPVIWMFLSAAFDAYNVCNRRILPVYPFLILFAAQLTTVVFPKWIKQTLFAVICGWSLIGAVQTYPFHLSYFNEASGGAAAGIRRLDECNVDWGQGLPQLAAYMAKNQIAEVRMPAEEAGDFGRADYYGVRHQVISTEEEYLSPPPAVYALSAHRVVWLKKESQRRHDPRWDWMERFQPTGDVGHSILIYDFRSSINLPETPERPEGPRDGR